MEEVKEILERIAKLEALLARREAGLRATLNALELAYESHPTPMDEQILKTLRGFLKDD